MTSPRSNKLVPLLDELRKTYPHVYIAVNTVTTETVPGTTYTRHPLCELTPGYLWTDVGSVQGDLYSFYADRDGAAPYTTDRITVEVTDNLDQLDLSTILHDGVDLGGGLCPRR